MISRAIAILGPEETPYSAGEDIPPFLQRQIEICAVVDPTQGPDCTFSMGLPVFSSLAYAIARTGIHRLVYGDTVIVVQEQWAQV